jgi:hypothetical protein
MRDDKGSIVGNSFSVGVGTREALSRFATIGKKWVDTILYG